MTADHVVTGVASTSCTSTTTTWSDTKSEPTFLKLVGNVVEEELAQRRRNADHDANDSAQEGETEAWQGEACCGSHAA